MSNSNDVDFVLYTCIVRGYDHHPGPISHQSSCQDLILFSEYPYQKSSNIYNYPLKSTFRLSSGHDINRFHKLFPHRLFPKTRFSIYVDGNIAYKANYTYLVECLHSSGAALAAFRHPADTNLRSGCTLSKEHNSHIEGVSEIEI